MYSPCISAFFSSHEVTRMIIQLQAATIRGAEGYLYLENSLQSLRDLKGVTSILNSVEQQKDSFKICSQMKFTVSYSFFVTHIWLLGHGKR